jgi:Flp pilus assembly secretin CpaC
MRPGLGVSGIRRLGALLFCVAAMTAGNAAAEETIDLTIDFAKILRLDGQAGTIVIGNPGIADATVENETTLVLTGRAAGATNIIVLDLEGEEMVNASVRVSSNVQQLTTIFYGGQRRTFSCAPTCEQVILAGDSAEAFTTAAERITSRQQFSAGQ